MSLSWQSFRRSVCVANFNLLTHRHSERSEESPLFAGDASLSLSLTSTKHAQWRKASKFNRRATLLLIILLLAVIFPLGAAGAVPRPPEIPPSYQPVAENDSF